MKKPLVFLLLSVLLLALPLTCHGQINYYKSSLSNYVKIDSVNEATLDESGSRLVLILSRDATFIKDSKTGKTVPFETFHLKLEVVSDNIEKEPQVKQDDVTKPLFNKKTVLAFVIGTEEFAFDKLFANISFNKNAANFDIRKKLFADLLGKDAEHWSLRLQIHDDIVIVPVPQKVIEEWREILAADMMQITESDLPSGKGVK